MTLSVSNKLMLAFIGLTSIVLISTLGLARWSFDQGFLDYVNATEAIRLQRISGRLSVLYLAHDQDWKKIDPTILIDELGLTEVGLNSGHPTAIFDLQGVKIFGDRLDGPEDEFTVSSIRLEGQTIAYLKSSPQRLLSSSIETNYSRQQLATSGFIAVQSLLLAIIVSFILVKFLLKPLRKLIFGINEISKGNYSEPFAEKRADEFGQLMSNVDHLAYTLRKSQDTRQRWLADISHELRTPLTVLTADIDLLKHGIRPLTQDSLLLIDKQVAALRVMTDDLYQLSVSDIGGLRYEYNNIDLTEQVLEVLETYKSSAESKGLALDFNQTGRHIIRADKERIRQLLSNLLSNSIAYTDAPGKVMFNLSSEAGKILLTLKDTAPGASFEECTQLFDPLYRQDKSRNRQVSGAGLGLAICRNIVEAHQGIITAAPALMGGIEIKVELPISHEKIT